MAAVSGRSACTTHSWLPLSTVSPGMASECRLGTSLVSVAKDCLAWRESGRQDGGTLGPLLAVTTTRLRARSPLNQGVTSLCGLGVEHLRHGDPHCELTLGPLSAHQEQRVASRWRARDPGHAHHLSSRAGPHPLSTHKVPCHRLCTGVTHGQHLPPCRTAGGWPLNPWAGPLDHRP